MPNPTLVSTPFANTGTKNDIPDSGATQPQLATMQAGFPAITQVKISEGGIPPERADFNGILNLYGQHVVHLNKGLPYEYDATFASQIGGYPLHARIMLTSGDIVQCTTANNTNDPNVNMAGWKPRDSQMILVDSRKLGLVGGVDYDQNSAVIACNNYVNSIPVYKDIPIVLRLPRGLIRSSVGFAFDRQTILFAEGDSLFDYTGTEYAVRLGKLGVTDYTDGFRTFGISGVCFTGADNCKHGIYVSQYVLAPTLESVKFNDFGNPNDANSYCVFFQAHNWDIYIRNCKLDGTLKNNINLIRVNGVLVDGTPDYGNSRLNHIDSFYNHGGNDCAGVGLYLNSFKSRVIGGGFQGYKTSIQIGEYGQTPEINGTYFETIYQNCESIFKIGDDGYTSEKVFSDISLLNIYANLHNINNEFGDTDVKFLTAAGNVKINNIKLDDLKTLNGDKYPLMTLNALSSQSCTVNKISHNNALLHNLRDDQMLVSNPEYNHIPNSDLKIWQRGSEFTFVNNVTKLADGFSIIGDGNTGNVKVYNEPLSPAYNFPSTANGMMRLVREVASNGTYNTLRFRVGSIDTLVGQQSIFSMCAKSSIDMDVTATFVQDYGGGNIVYTSIGSFNLKSSPSASNIAKAFTIANLNRSYVKTGTARTYIDISLPLSAYVLDVSCFLLSSGIIRTGWISKSYIEELEHAKHFYQKGLYSTIQDQTRVQIPLIPQMRYSPTSRVHINYQDGVANYDATIVLSEQDRIVFGLNARSQDISASWTADGEI